MRKEEKRGEEKMRMGVNRKKGFCVVFLFLISIMLLNINCCSAVSLEINSTTSWCNGSIDECLMLYLDFELNMEPEFSRMLGDGNHPAVNANKPNKPAVNNGPGKPYNCGKQNRECHPYK